LDRILIIVGKNSKVKLLQISPTLSNNHSTITNAINTNLSNPQLRIEVIETIVNEESEVFFGNLQNHSSNLSNFSVKKADVKKNGILTNMDCCFGGDLTISQVQTDLQGQGAKTYNWGIFFGTKQQQYGIFLKNSHNYPNTLSDMLTKGVVDNEAKSIYNGTVRIIENATGSNGYQKQDVLLLSKNAGADAKPNLEIDNNDVRCTHGVSIGQVDKDKIFYMMSRGLDEEQAKKKLVEGFFDTILRKIKLPELKEEVNKLVLISLYGINKND